MGFVTVGHILHLLPEVRHSGIGIVATHGPDGIGVRTCDENIGSWVLGVGLQWQDAIVFEENDRLSGNVISRLTLLRCI